MSNPLKNNLILLGLLFLIAAIPRLSFLNLIEFKADEALSLWQLAQFYNSPHLFQTGLIASNGMYNFPLFNFLLIPLTFFSLYPPYVSFLIALLNTIFICLFFLGVQKYFSKFIAFIASIALATSPWNILLNRKIWAQDLIFILALPFFYFLTKTIYEKQKKSQAYAAFFLALLSQLHLSGLFLIIPTIFTFYAYKIKPDFKKITIGIAIGLIPSLSYFYYQTITSCRDCQAFFQYQNIPKSFDTDNFFQPLRLLTGLTIERLLGTDAPSFLQHFPYLKYSQLLFPVLSSFVTFGIILTLTKFKNYAYLSIFMLLVPLFFFITQTPSRIHYYLIIIPQTAILIGIAIEYLKNSISNSIIKKTFCVIIFLLFLGNQIFTLNLFQFLQLKKDINGDYGPIFELTQQKTDQALKPHALVNNNLLTHYTYLFVNTPHLHTKLGEFFIQSSLPKHAFYEFDLALQENPLNTTARANLAYIYILNKENIKAQEHINILETQDSTLSAKLKQLLPNN